MTSFGQRLHELIRSLTPSEQRHIKLYGSIQRKSNPLYLELFECLLSVEEFDEERVEDAFAGSELESRFTATARYLREVIMRGLRSYHDSSTPGAQITSLLSEADILQRRGMSEEGLRTLKRAERLAEGERLESLLPEIWRRQLAWSSPASTTPAQRREELIRRLEILERLGNDLRTEYIGAQFNDIFFRQGRARTDADAAELEQILVHPILDDESTRRTSRGDLSGMETLATGAFASNDFDKAVELLERRSTIFESNTSLRRELPGQYVAVLTNLLVLRLRRREFEEAEELFQRLDELTVLIDQGLFGNETITLQIFRFTSGLRLGMYFIRGMFEQGCAEAGKIVTEAKAWESQLSNLDRFRLFYHVACLNFGTGEYGRGLEFLREALHNADRGVQTGVVRAARLLELVLLFESGDYTTLEYRAEALRRKLQRGGTYYRTESALLRAFGRLPNPHAEEEMISWYESLHSELQLLEADPLERNAHVDFPFIDWVSRGAEKFQCGKRGVNRS